MNFIPRSIRGRLLLAALVFTSVALVFASVSINEALERFIRRGVNERLDAQIALLTRSVRDDGSIDRAMLDEIGPFTQHDFGWGWRIQAPGDTLTSKTLPSLANLHAQRERRGRGPRTNRPRSEGSDAAIVRTLRKTTAGGTVTITAAAPRVLVDRMRAAALTPLLLSLGALAVFLIGATLLQLRIGLRPLGRLRQSLASVRAGTTDRIPGEQPIELREMVDELNGLLDENEAALARARGHVSNLAHSLKTPLATLSVKLSEGGRDPNGELSRLVAQIDRGIRHHLGRARAASPGAPGRPQVALAPAIGGLVDALGRIHADRGVAARIDAAAGLSVQCDPQDLDEMMGNLLDNAWKWAASAIVVTAAANGAAVEITIDDDGPGITDAAIEKALVPGLRLDERGDGHGFGLPIARELAELHGGALALGPSPLGGLRVTLTLPG